MMENNPLFWRSDRNLFLAYNYGIKDWIHFESWMDFKLSLKSILSLFSLSPFPSPPPLSPSLHPFICVSVYFSHYCIKTGHIQKCCMVGSMAFAVTSPKQTFPQEVLRLF